MTGVQRPRLWSLPTRVELAEGAVIEFKEHGQRPARLSQTQIDKMFEIGLMQPPLASDRRPDATASVSLEGDARFLVGEVDLGRDVGIEVLVRGLEPAAVASYREYRERPPRTEAGEDADADEVAFDEPDLLGRSREVRISVDQAGERLDDLLEEIGRGTTVVLIRDGKRVAVMASWPSYVDLRERSAQMAAAFWSAWRSGVFDADGYATDVTRILHRGPRTTPAPRSDDGSSTSKRGDGDERVR